MKEEFSKEEEEMLMLLLVAPPFPHKEEGGILRLSHMLLLLLFIPGEGGEEINDLHLSSLVHPSSSSAHSIKEAIKTFFLGGGGRKQKKKCKGIWHKTEFRTLAKKSVFLSCF